MTVFDRLRQLAQYLAGQTPDDMPAVCQSEGCTIVVPPFEGVRRGGMVWCSEAHERQEGEAL